MKIDIEYTPRAPSRGFIVFEGVNGAGKSTLIARIQSLLSRREREVVVTREPGATPLGSALRSILIENETLRPSPRAELLLFGADRAHHISTVIEPALARGAAVLCDRYYYSTIAFQGFGRGIDRPLIDDVCRVAVNGVTPDLVILLDLPPEEGLRRIALQKGLHAKDSFEQEHLEFHHRVRSGFLEIAQTLPEPFLILDAQESPEAIAEAAQRVILSVLSTRGK